MACQKIKYGGWKTGSNCNFEITLGIHEIPTAKPMFSRSLNPMDLFPILSNNGKYPEMEVMTLSRPEIVITMQQKGLSVKFQR